MRGCPKSLAGGFAPLKVATIGVSIVLGPLGCARQEDAVSQAPSLSPVTAKQPKLSLTVQPPADPGKLKKGEALVVQCTVVRESGEFEPMIVRFSVRDLKAKDKALVVTSQTVAEKIGKDREFTFLYKTTAPDRTGRYRIDARVVGVDASVPVTGPPPAPSADGTPIKPGARVEYDAPGLEIEVRP